jgi:hypothetical protein
MAFVITALYALALFGAGVMFIRRGKKEKREEEEHCAVPGWNGSERRSGHGRRRLDQRTISF